MIKQLKFYILLIFSTFSFAISFSQVITSNPIFPIDTDSCTITFYSDKGSGGLNNYSGDIYAHTGVITNNSTSTSDWKYVKTNWGTNTPETKLTKIANNTYQLKIKPSIRAYYGVPSGEKILKIALVFRSAAAVGGSYLEGKTETGSDIFQQVFEPGLQVALDKPTNGFSLLQLGDTLNLKANAIFADSLILFLNNIEIKAVSGNLITHQIIANQFGKFWIKAIAKNNTSQIADSFYFFVNKPADIEALPVGTKKGINYLNAQSVVLCLYAPQKKSAFVIGDFNDWQLDTTGFMKLSPDSNYFWIQLNNLQAGKEYIYQYLVDGSIKIADPYCEKVSDPWNDSYISSSTYPNMISYPAGKTSGIASVFQTNQSTYYWQNTSFTPPPKNKLIVYELLIRDFTAKHTFQSIIDSLNYFKTLGINAIEFMPVNEFEGNSSWGYNCNFYFAVDKYYGHKNDFKKLIDTLHQNGIAVIMDVVYNHSFGTSPYVQLYWDSQNNRPSSTSPFYNPIAKHDYNVGYDMNHSTNSTKQYISDALKFWLTEYKVDGFRFDLSKGFTQNNTLGNTSAWGMYDASRVSILKSYYDTIMSVNSKAFTILEHFADNSEEQTLSNMGMMLWGNSNSSFAEAAMGYNTGSKSDFSYVSYQTRGWSNPNLVGYMESHDEERLLYKCSQWGNSSGDYNTKNIPTYLMRMRLDALFFLSIPGPKMIWQFGELGYDVSIDFNGRTGEKPIKWEYFTDTNRYNVYQFYSGLLKLREEQNVFTTTNYQLSVQAAFKRIILSKTDTNFLILGNFDVISQDVNPQFPHTGMWYEYLNGDSLDVKNTDEILSFLPGEYHIYTDQKIDNKYFKDFSWQKNFKPIYEFGKMYPNPAIGDVTIVIQLDNQTPTEVKFEFIDIQGKKAAEYSKTIKEYEEITISDIGVKLRSGLYMVKITAGDKSSTLKLMVY